MLIAFIVIISLSILILGHEAGHFFAAKFFGIKVSEFGFGFPPRIKAWRFKRKKGLSSQISFTPKNLPSKFSGASGETWEDETEYSFNFLPFGGFVKIAGEEEQITSPEKLGELSPEEKKKYFLFQPAWKRFVVIASGVSVNFAIGWFLLSVVFMLGAPSSAIVVGGVQVGSPAEKAGIAAGDIIKNYSTADNFRNFVNKNRGQEINLQIIRGGKELEFKAVPRVSTKQGEGALGVEFSESGIKPLGFFSALVAGFKESIYISGATFAAFYELLKNLILRGSLLAGVVGPVGIFAIAQKTGELGIIYLFQLIAFISLNLAVLNLIPFPALDGGRLFLIIIEKLKGSPVSVKTQSLINSFGFALLLFLMVIITVRDVVNLF